MSESKELVSWEERLANEAKAVAAVERPSVTGISLKSGIMSINDAPVPGNSLDCVILAAVFENTYYESAYDPSKIVPPTCFALGRAVPGQPVVMIPHEAVPEPINGDCETCEFMKWNSDPRPNSRGKACKEKRRLVLIPAVALKDGEIAKAEMATMTLPVTSVRNWGTYVNRLAAEFSRPYWAVATKVSVVPHMKNQFEVKFDAIAAVNEQFLDPLSKRIESAFEVGMVPYDMTPQPEAPAKQAPAAGKKY